jgi:3-oxoacyl-[acyl-carrier protein] reductase
MTGRSVVVVGGSRGLGLGVARAARDEGARVTVVARDVSPLDAVEGVTGEQGDAGEEAFAEKVLSGARPDLVVVTAGAAPPMRPLSEQTWETFSVNWQADVRIAFTWLRAALRVPLAPGSRVVVFGSAAELRGSPLSGGYAGAKATVRLITGYAGAEAKDLGITMTTVLPGITPGTGVGETAIRAYGIDPEKLGAVPGPESVGRSIVGLSESDTAAAYLLDAGGLRPL